MSIFKNGFVLSAVAVALVALSGIYSSNAEISIFNNMPESIAPYVKNGINIAFEKSILSIQKPGH
ncbi:hypothetical protein I862_04200 [endosymbiont of Acanthamoeba sp. UWC8]|uniref:hypothetical protein n=1 Tax=endosymbiont of Acanthamoeba sp. UWC8 TaxID=86106 RepID=UPI0004D1691F|nr:hypothetical protein [endosymbiont of Acanthamoeba sp. UWC8]AIF81400.1 hypothetical protein I862_04200 [endosymbiont of Acanthamoeba sp. UWC8]